MSKASEGAGLRGDVVIEVSKDKMTAKLILHSLFTEDQPPQEEDILAALRNGGIRRGISRSALIEVLRNPVYDQAIVIARGHPPAQGEDSSIEFRVSVDRKEAAPRCLATGQVDFKSLNLIETVKKGTVVGIKKPPTPGIPGYNVYGEELKPKPGKDRPVKVGKNVELSADGTQLISMVDGAVSFSGDRVSVTPLVEVKGDIDYSVGNIDFTGSVTVHGSVLAGFSVKADGDLTIFGTVEAATLQCTGILSIKGGVVGQGRATLTAGGDIVARFISEANVTAGGSVITDGPMLHSRIRAEKKVMASGRKGMIAGGQTTALEGVMAESLGSSMGTRTEILIEVDEAIQTRARELQNQTAERQKVLDKERQHLEQYSGVPLLTLSAEQRVEFDSAHKVVSELEKEIAVLNEELSGLQEIIDTARASTVKVNNEVFPGVVVGIMGAYLTVNDALKALTFVREKGEIVTKSTF